MRLPDFVFGRDEDREAAGGLRLAGVIITDFPKPEAQLSVAEWREIQDFVNELTAAAVRGDSNLHEAGFWREVPPPDRFVPPFPEEIVRQRMVGHLVLTFDVAGDGMVYVIGSECGGDPPGGRREHPPRHALRAPDGRPEQKPYLASGI